MDQQRTLQLGLVLSVLALFGCTTTTYIPASSLPQLNGNAVSVEEEDEQIREFGFTQRTVEDVNGEPVDVRGGFTAKVVRLDGRRIELARPIQTQLHTDTISLDTVWAQNEVLRIDDIRHVAIERIDPWMSALVSILVGAAVVVTAVWLTSEFLN